MKISNKKVYVAAAIIIFLIISLLLIFPFTFSTTTTDSSWDGVVANSFTSGTGSEANPYVISSAGEFAYLKELLESDEASLYIDKYYKLTKSFNYGGHNITINNSLPFTGTIDGNGKTISNITINNSLFNDIDQASIKNIALKNIQYSLKEKSGAILANNISESNIEMLIVTGDIYANENSTFGGLVYSSNDSKYSNIVLNYNVISESKDIYKVAYEFKDSEGSNILVNKSDIDNIQNDAELKVNNFEVNKKSIDLGNTNIDDYKNDEHYIKIINDEFIFDNDTSFVDSFKVIDDDIKLTAITPHATGTEGTTAYLNDLTADRNYFIGLNYAEIRNTNIPSGVSTGYYDDEYLVKVQITYDGADINTPSLVGAISPVSGENHNKLVYYKYYALERNSNGTLATDANGNNYIRIELIDNPFTKRPYANSIEYGFNGWVCNDEGANNPNICDDITMYFKKENYTRYMDVVATGGSEITIHLNATWYEADVVTSANNITSFNSMSMQPIPTHPVQSVVHHIASYRWRNNYTTMVFYRNYTRNQTMPNGYYFKTNQSSTTYTRVRNNNRTCNSTTCYVYQANTSGILANSVYDGSSRVEIAPNFNNNNTVYMTVITSYNSTYMQIVDDPNGNYEYDETVTKNISDLIPGQTVGGYYYQVSNPTTAMLNTREYYTNNGTLCTSTSSCTTAYKLIQYEDSTTNSDGTSIYHINVGSDDYIVDQAKYYYLVTRDLNIFRYTSTTALSFEDIEVNRPFTITGISRTGTTPTGVLEYPSTYSWFSGYTYSDFTAANDLVIENIKIDGPDTTGSDNATLGANSKTSQVIYANSHNLKIGRNVTSDDGNDYLIGEAVFGGINNSVSGTFRVIVESGIFYAYHSGAMSGSNNFTLNETTIFGSDYDRIKNDNDNLKFLIGLDGYAGGHHTAGSDSIFVSFNTVKSGTFGYNSDDTPSTDNTSGMYIGGRSSPCVESITGAKVEGGKISIIVGGYGYNGTATTNSTYIGMSGGNVRSIYGGAGHSTTKGNRIINVTGGTVSYSILGGSDSYDSGDDDDGIIQGSTLVYVGGNVSVGGGTGTVQGVEAGSVFGAGGGDTTSDQKGTVYNSHVIINGGTISGSVYGGGNYGSTGTQSNAAATTKIEVLSGTIGNIYGGSKSAGFSKSAYSTTSAIDIDISGGTIGNVYGGSDAQGICYGNVTIDISDGHITNNVYGGGKGNQTFISSNVNVTIGDTVVNKPTIDGSVYGGSAFGTVNATTANGNATGSTSVTVNNGVITGSVFGGGQGSTTYTPHVQGNITVTINDGDITNVFGGNDQAGSHTQQNRVYLNGGTIDNVYGGGNKSSVTTTNVYLQGSDVTTLYGGSNTLGDVTTTNVTLSSGTVGTAYGGNNEGGSTGTTNVVVTGTAEVSTAIYGGGNQVNTTTTNVTLNSATGTIPNVYGGGNNASVTTANITKNGTTVTSLFGGSNSSGTVSTVVINQNGGTTTNIYGGNNAGGTTLASTINYVNGSSTNIFGGGNSATHGTTAVNVTNGTITNIYGGGNNEGVTSTTVTIGNNSTNSLDIGTVYGGSNASGTVAASSVVINAGEIDNVYGGNNLGGTLANPTITVNNGTITQNIYGGGNQAQATGNVTLTFNNGTVSNIFGAGNLAAVTGNVTLDVLGGTVSNNVYGGGNEGEVYGNTVVTLKNTAINDKAFAGGNGSSAVVRGNTTINVGQNTTVGTSNSTGLSGSVFGSGNQAPTGRETTDNSIATVNITGGTIYGNVYGGANTSVVYGTVNLNVGKTTISDQTLVTRLGYSDITINGTIFGGGESNAEGAASFDYDAISVTQGITINIDGTGYNNFNTYGSIFGSGNASNTPANKPSTINIKNYGTISNPHSNASIQRVKVLIIDNSSIELSGVRDSTDDYHPNELFSLNRIEKLILKNNSSLFLREGTNFLEEFNSQDASGNKAYVTIDDSGIVTQNVDNRVYTIEGGHMNVAHDGSATDYANVYGMTFFGMYNISGSGHVSMKMYDPSVEHGDTITWADTPVSGSYVLGKHETNHDITVDGFYTNYYDEDTLEVSTLYIDPTPEASPYYYWMIGENVTEYNINLEASKYATLGTVELILRGLEAPNTSFQILGFDYSGLNDGINLVDKSTIRGIASTTATANSTFGLSMESGNVGWLNSGTTSYYNNSNNPITGTTYYIGDNTSDPPSFLFYLYHYKNLSETLDLGTVVIQMMAITQIDDINSELQRLVITVDLSTVVYTTSEYEGAMTPGKKYELFTSTTTKITDNSSFSAYYSLYSSNNNVYRPGYKHVLTSNYVFPENTKLTLVDLSLSEPRYYYYIISAQDVINATNELNTYNEVTYPLSKFVMMDTVANDTYDDATMNGLYYTSIGSLEEFIIQVDFADATIASNQLNKYLYPELQDANGNLIISALAIERPDLQFSIYVGQNAVISVDATISNNTIYNGNNALIEVESTFTSNQVSSDTIYDTTYFDDDLGLSIYLTTTTLDENDNEVTERLGGNALLGSYFSINGVNYYPDASGITRLKFADRVGNIKSYITFNLTNALIATGDYKINIEIFGSSDGIHYSNDPNKVSSTDNIDVRIVLSGYGLNATLDDTSIIISNADTDRSISGSIAYTSYLNNPNIRLRMYRRKYDGIYTTEYEVVDLQDYSDDNLVSTYTQKSYLIVQNPRANNTFSVALVDGDLLTGTYRLDFELYDSNSMIGKHEVYIVIKDD